MSMKTIIKEIVGIGLLAAAFLLMLFMASALFGCSTSKVTLPDGTVIIHQPFFLETKAVKVEFYFQDPNHVVWLIVDDPNRAVNPGALTVIEPRTGVNFNLKAE